MAASRPSPGSAERARFGWLTVAAALTLVTALAGCGGTSAGERVADYVRGANAVQQRAAPRLQRANRAYVAFSQGKLTATQAATALAVAEHVIRDVRAQLAAIVPPPEARELHRRLVALFDTDADLARESTLLARYVAPSSAALRRLETLARALRRGLRNRTPETQARALSAYGAGIETVVAKLTRLQPPLVLFDRHRAEIARLRSVASLARRLRSALRARDPHAVARLLRHFRRVNERSGAADRVAASAVRAYNHRYKAVRRAEQAVAEEEQRIVREYR